MLFIDDFLTRRYWDTKPYPHGLGVNIPYDYKEMSIEEEWEMLKKVHEMGIPFKVFIVGKVLELAETNPEIAEAIKWLVDNKIEICGHGWFHTEQEWIDGYVDWAEKVWNILLKYQKPLFIWRYPRHEEVNREHIESLGFKIETVEKLLDEQFLKTKDLSLLKGHDKYNAMIHSCYLTRPIRKYLPTGGSEDLKWNGVSK